MDRKVTFSGCFAKEAEITVPASKSYVHRMLICGALAKGKTVISGVNFSEDIHATLFCLREMGCEISTFEDKIEIVGGTFRKTDDAVYDCRESASTLRFMIPVVLSVVGGGKFTGSSMLLKRPLDTYFQLFEENGVSYEYKAGEHLTIRGRFENDEYILDGSVSSQFITGMLLSLAYMGGKKKIHIRGSLSSAPYIDITIEVLNLFGVKVSFENNVFTVDATNGLNSCEITAQGDYSQAAFFLVAAALGGKITLRNLSSHTSQGDAVIVDILKEMGGDIIRESDCIIMKKSCLKSVGTIDARHFPDIVPPLALLCTQCKGDTVITNVSRLKIKESDRLSAVETLLKSFGADVRTDENNIYIRGEQLLHGAAVSSFNDHRIAMTAAVAAVVTAGAVVIGESESVKKSYPHFFEDFVKLGGICVE